jgi:cell division protein ZapE
MTPLNYYRQQCANGLISEDQQQLAVLEKLQKIYFELIKENKHRSGWFSWLYKPKLITGIYLWGGVGIGKTLLMDCFYKCLPFNNKMRMHFHQFMQLIHTDLVKYQGKSDPLQLVAREIASQTMILCFDELFVSDITDAMLLGRLFKALFDNGVCLVVTSNTPPNDLYKNGLQRSQFLPAIALLKQHTQVVHIPTAIDYRLRHLKEAGVFYTPLDQAARQNMEKTFSVLAEGKNINDTPIEIYGRLIQVVKQTDDVIWFEFSEICKVPRSQKDYLEISQKYRTVFISNIPIIEPNAKDTICLFISLVDVFYDANVRLVISAAEPVPEIYSRGYMILEYTRTNSRLLEMQSMDYFAGEESLDISELHKKV